MTEKKFSIPRMQSTYKQVHKALLHFPFGFLACEKGSYRDRKLKILTVKEKQPRDFTGHLRANIMH